MFKKLILLLFLLIMSSQYAHAASFNYIPTADAEYTDDSSGPDNTGFDNYYSSLTALKDSYNDSMKIPFLKFNISIDKDNNKIDLNKEKIVSATLNLTSCWSYNNVEGPNVMDTYFVSDDTWVEPDYGEFAYASKPVIDTTRVLNEISLSENYSDYIPLEINLDVAYLNTKLDEIKLNNLISLALVNVTQSGDGYDPYGEVVFFSKEKGTKSASVIPMLKLETAPIQTTPEPSSIILGLLGIGSILGYKRRKI